MQKNASHPILVLKIGTSSITKLDGSLNELALVELARQVARLHARWRMVIVSSGAVGAGKGYLKNYTGGIIERKAAAAIGNPLLLNKYTQFFAPYGIPIAQSLCERHHFSDRKQFLQLRDTFEELWKNGIIPIANENDVVNNLEIKFSDNDELATLIAIGFGADLLLLGTSVAGVYNQKGELVPEIMQFDENVMGYAQKEKSPMGLGGMLSKLTFAHLATKMGIKTIIFGLETSDAVLLAAEGKTGTICHPQLCEISARKKWLASGGLVRAQISIDDGACKALQNRNSLLAVGVLKIKGGFAKGEVIEITNSRGESIAVARSKISSQKLENATKQRQLTIAHADDIVLL